MHLLHPSPDPAPDLDALYLHPPGVRLGMVASADGAASLQGRSGQLGGPADKQVFRTLRRHCDVVLVGAGTARDEGYRPVRMAEEHLAQRAARGQRPVPVLAVVTRGRGLHEGSPLLEPGSGLLLLTTQQGARRAPAGTDVEVVGDDEVDLPRALAVLRERGLPRVLCEGGPTLNGALLAQGLVDELCVTTSPLLVGGAADRLVRSPEEQAVPLELVHLLAEDSVLLARWRVVR